MDQTTLNLFSAISTAPSTVTSTMSGDVTSAMLCLSAGSKYNYNAILNYEANC